MSENILNSVCWVGFSIVVEGDGIFNQFWHLLLTSQHMWYHRNDL